MIDGLRPYPEMKPTGLPWLGNVPAHWNVRRIKTLLREVDSRTVTGEERLLSLRMRQGLVDHIDAGGKPIDSEALIGFKIIEPRQVVMNRMRAASGLFGVASVRGLVSPDYAVFEPKSDAFTPYLLHAFRLPSLAAVFRAESKGLGTGEAGFLRLYTDRFGPIPVPYPPLDEQRLIVRFLDWHGGRTAKLIRAKKKLIALLNEQKQAIIHRAVTRGLDPNVKLKPSGIPWLGNVPEGWEVKRLRTLARHVTSGSRGWSRYAADYGPLFIRIGNLTRTSIALDLREKVSLSLPKRLLGEAGRTRVQPNDILLSITAYIGSVAVIGADIDEAYVSQHVACCRLRGDVASPKWVGYVLLSPVGQTHGTLCMYGGTKQGLSLDDVKNYVVVLPPRDEQNVLVTKIETETANIDAEIRMVERQIALIQEFRTRLIADVVTGKLDVRTAAAALPETAEEPEDLDAPIEAVDDDELEDAGDAEAEEAA
jgi:type I restriction enzyme S subunit